MDDDGIPAGHVANSNAGSQDYFPSGLYRVDGGMIQDRNVPVGHKRAFYR